MRVSLLGCLFLLAGVTGGFAGPAEYPSNVAVRQALATGTTANGAPIAYPQTGAPEVKVLVVDIPPGAETGWHRHPLPAVAYIVSGSITVELEDGKRYTAKAGEAFAEVVNTRHNGRNLGTEPVRIILTVMGEKGVPVTEK